MPLEHLFGLVEELRKRIQTHSAALRQSEALTRYALIDPLLRELGWDTGNPDEVRPEYQSGSGSADYALLRADVRPIIMIEAKRLDTPLRDNVLAQGIQYCLMQGTPYFAVTDGRRWEIYETHRAAPIDEKRVAGFDLSHQSVSETALGALALWRSNIQAGTVTLAQSPLAARPRII